MVEYKSAGCCYRQNGQDIYELSGGWIETKVLYDFCFSINIPFVTVAIAQLDRATAS